MSDGGYNFYNANYRSLHKAEINYNLAAREHRPGPPRAGRSLLGFRYLLLDGKFPREATPETRSGESQVYSNIEKPG